MNLKRLINDYVECNTFEIKYKYNKFFIYYYDKVKHFSNNEIIILEKNNMYIVKGKKLVIETMFEEFIVISGNIEGIMIRNLDE